MSSSRLEKCETRATCGMGVSRVKMTTEAPSHRAAASSGSSLRSHASTSRPHLQARPSGLVNTCASSASWNAIRCAS